MLYRRSSFRPDIAAHLWPPIERFIGGEERLGQAAEARGPFAAGCYEFLRFGIKEGWACLFGGLMCALLIATHLWYPRDIAVARYDFLFLAALTIQAVFLAVKLETWEAAKTIFLFHLVGTVWSCSKPRSARGSIQSRVFSGWAASRSSPASCTPPWDPMAPGLGACSIFGSSIIRRS
jgi:hypothetical protein